MEVTWPHERQHGPRETADESHEQSKVWNCDGHCAGEEDEAKPQRQAPPGEMPRLVEAGRETSFGPSLAEGSL